MALWKTPGPEGLDKDRPSVDEGTLARLFSPIPGPVGLYIFPKVSTPSAQVATPPKFGIRINEASQISADDWVKKINSSNDVDDYFKPQIQSQDRMIFVTDPKRFKTPKNVIQKIWLVDWLSAFMFAEWEMTTGFLDISVNKGDAKGPSIKIVHKPDLSSGDSIDGFSQHTMTSEFRSTASAQVEVGITLPDGATLSSKRKKLIVIASRISLSLGDKTPKPFKMDDSELLKTWFHEIACHAGENTEGNPDIHGDVHVDSCAADIDAMFPSTSILSKVFLETDAFLKASAPSKPSPPSNPGAPLKKPGTP